jgi:hypothetical protein
MGSGATIKGLVEQTRKIQNYARKFPTEFAEAQFEETMIEAEECVKRTPVDTGDLQATVHATRPSIQKNVIRTTVTAGGPEAPYAIYVHENLFAHHAIGQAKFIESTLFESAPFMLRRIVARMKG